MRYRTTFKFVLTIMLCQTAFTAAFADPGSHASCQGQCIDGTAPRPIPDNLFGACTCNPPPPPPPVPEVDCRGLAADTRTGSCMSGPLNTIGD